MQRLRTLVVSLAWAACLMGVRATSTRAQTPMSSPQSWLSLTTGFGPALVSIRGDTVFEGSGQAFLAAAYVRRLAPNRAVAVEGLGGRPFAAGDCLPGFSICAPAFNFVGVASTMLLSLGVPIAPDRFVAGVGGGLFRVAASESQSVSPGPALAFRGIAEAPLVTGSRAALAIGVHALIFPVYRGQSLGVGLLTLSLRTW